MKKPRCLNPTCSLHGNVASRRIIRYGFYRTTAGKRRRYRCVGCGRTFSTTKGTPYYRSGRVRMGVIPDFKAATITGLLKQHVAPG